MTKKQDIYLIEIESSVSKPILSGDYSRDEARRTSPVLRELNGNEKSFLAAIRSFKSALYS